VSIRNEPISLMQYGMLLPGLVCECWHLAEPLSSKRNNNNNTQIFGVKWKNEK
jgi:hypothetical protein